MASKEDEFEPADAEEYSDFVPAVFARNMEEAEEYRELLNEHDIPAMVGSQDEEENAPRRGMTRGVPVLVPEVLLDEASEIIADLEEEQDEFDEDEEETEEEEEIEDEEEEEDEDIFDDEEEEEDEDEDEDIDILDEDDEEEQEDEEY